MRRLCLLILVAAAIVLFAPMSWAQAPKPGPEHEHLKQMEGVWDATVNIGGQESKGTMTYKMDLGGMWLVGMFEGDFFGQKFQGRAADTYDPASKKYVGVWIDSMSTRPMVSEGTFDPEKRIMTMMGEGPGQDGKMVKHKSTLEIKDKDNMIMKMYGPEGKDEPMMTITYKRKG
jgi:hypothetical protein